MSAQLYRQRHELQAQAEQSKALMHESRIKDMERFRGEATDAGFEWNDITLLSDHGEMHIQINEKVVLQSDSHYTPLPAIWNVHGVSKNGYLQLTPELIEHFKFTPEQVYFLEWSRGLAHVIHMYWKDLTKLDSIDEVIEDMKQKYDPIFSTPGQKTKSAAKK